MTKTSPRRPIVSCALAFLVMLAILTGCGKTGADLWPGVQEQLSRDQFVSLEIFADGPKKAVIEAAGVAEFVDALKSGNWVEDNPENFGPTSPLNLLFWREDGTEFTVAQWPDGRFQITSHGLQFLVSAPLLEQILRDMGFVTELT
jgi:hypothetical protein